MNILIIGCGKVGSRLAIVLSKKGHDVSIVNRTDEGFNLLPNDFNGFTTVGVPIDQDVLKKAGIESCDAVAAVTQDDNVNIMVSELAKELFKVPKVYTRIYDTSREDVFSHFGLQTVCPTNLTVDTICAALEDDNCINKLNLGTRTITFTSMCIPKEFIGQKVSDIEFENDEVLFAIERENDGLILVGLKDLKLDKNDKLIFSKIVD